MLKLRKLEEKKKGWKDRILGFIKIIFSFPMFVATKYKYVLQFLSLPA